MDDDTNPDGLEAAAPLDASPLEPEVWVAADVVEPDPAEQALNDALAHAFVVDAVTNARRLAYQLETDPLAFKVLRGEATTEEYCAAVEAVRARFPYPDGFDPDA